MDRDEGLRCDGWLVHGTTVLASRAPTVKRMQRMEPDGGSSTDARVVQVEIQLDDPSSMPQVLGRETRVTFL